MISTIWMSVFASLAMSVIASAQCPKAEMLVEWDNNKHDFVCKASGGGDSLPIDHSFPGKTFQSEASQKEFCDVVLANELKACASGAPGASCRKRANANSARCMNKGGDGSSGKVGSAAPDLQPKPTVASCKKTFNEQVKACKNRSHPVPAAGEPPTQDTCLADATAARDACLATASQ
jgi:hypothetical protein